MFHNVCFFQNSVDSSHMESEDGAITDTKVIACQEEVTPLNDTATDQPLVPTTSSPQKASLGYVPMDPTSTLETLPAPSLSQSAQCGSMNSAVGSGAGSIEQDGSTTPSHTECLTIDEEESRVDTSPVASLAHEEVQNRAEMLFLQDKTELETDQLPGETGGNTVSIATEGKESECIVEKQSTVDENDLTQVNFKNISPSSSETHSTEEISAATQKDHFVEAKIMSSAGIVGIIETDSADIEVATDHVKNDIAAVNLNSEAFSELHNDENSSAPPSPSNCVPSNTIEAVLISPLVPLSGPSSVPPSATPTDPPSVPPLATPTDPPSAVLLHKDTHNDHISHQSEITKQPENTPPLNTNPPVDSETITNHQQNDNGDRSVGTPLSLTPQRVTTVGEDGIGEVALQQLEDSLTLQDIEDMYLDFDDFNPHLVKQVVYTPIKPTIQTLTETAHQDATKQVPAKPVKPVYRPESSQQYDMSLVPAMGQQW